MLEAAIKVLSQYIDESISRYTFTYVEVIRLDIEDFLYVCEVSGRWYLVYETDYMDNLPLIAKEAEVTLSRDFSLLHWLPKTKMNSTPIPLDLRGQKTELLYDTLRYELSDSYLRFAVIELKPKFEHAPRFHPSTYGGSK